MLKGESFTPSWILFCTIRRTLISWEKKYIRHFHLMAKSCCPLPDLIAIEFSRFTIRCPTSNWLRRGQNAHCIMGKCRQIKCHAIQNYTWICFKWPKMWIKWLHAKIHSIITVYIHYRTIYFKTITCIILIIVISNVFHVFACKTHSVFNDFIDYCNWQAQPHGGAHFVKRENW